ncbi:MAG TPA: 1-acyl-sn-glycerol-3-phosphate acyltransferase [Desulfobacteraceae bacterium]|nr:1-acyl-sn-glycerol-3-phosphate acyltransferase [Desulfobacteraceae bacterium]
MSPLQYIRALLTILLAGPLTLFFSVMTLLDIFLVRRSQQKVQVFPRTWGRIICRMAGVKVRIEGADNLAPGRTYIFVGNHVSQFDIFSFQGYFPHDFRWIAKKELFRIPFFGPAMLRSGIVPIDRSHGREALKSLNRAAEKIAGGTSVLIFPEGTRSRDGRLHPFKTGAVMLAIKAGVPVVPVGFNGTYAILPKGKLLPNNGEIIIRIGEPISPAGYKPRDKNKLADHLHDRVAELLDTEKRVLP